ncbi:hypothetical protein [Ectopseudomonas oleovorans]|uniref:Uncharacterized protein n=1 Tax=Ectopseudomonas oleovorans TaxID=301 RepID=A0AA42TYA3_ECTOL|nr:MULTISPECIES: hypothetical protein [Pseudomonas]MDH1338208.1 hypothetical protein [Pseudomonas oleovorans]MDH1494938.1 hypothetical protein [Pseudomonas oleovorans]MDH1867174.1 hypothetical protein [Pseudomonas chengduensis]WGG20133.1 hypothetical protein N5O83_17085 [Pseudomonas oleovorans]
MYQRFYPAILAATMFVIAFSSSVILMQIFPKICWLPRVGGLLVGLSVFIQSYMHVNMDRFEKPWRWGLTKDQIYSHVAYNFAIFGTLMWTFGDLIPAVLWLPNTGCGCSV